MTHIMLPFMILPLYSVMRLINPSYVRAARSLGANSWTAFWRVYFPQTIPDRCRCAAGLHSAVGYYITPALVGGVDGQLISNLIAHTEVAQLVDIALAIHRGAGTLLAVRQAVGII